MLKEHQIDRLNELCPDCQRRYQFNPLRILDCKICNLEKLPSYQEILTEKDLLYLKEVNEFLDKLEVNHCYNESLVRGLDYYTGIVFELLLLEGSKKSVILGGGRYDNLFRKLGGVNLPAAGFALGVDRLVDYLSSLNKNLG